MGFRNLLVVSVDLTAYGQTSILVAVGAMCLTLTKGATDKVLVWNTTYNSHESGRDAVLRRIEEPGVSHF